MNKYKKTAFGGLTIAAVLAGSLSFASAANAASDVPAPGNSDHPIYLLNANDGTQLAENTSLHWNDDFYFSPNAADINAAFPKPSGTVWAYEFISPRGSERTMNAWNAYTVVGNATDPVGGFDGMVS